MVEKLTKAQQVALPFLRVHWNTFTDADPVPEGFVEAMEVAGFARLRPVRKADVDDDPFAYERGIEIGGMLWELTPAGRAALSPRDDEGG